METVTKKVILSATILMFLTNFILAINLEVSQKEISNTALVDLNKPAIFDLTIRNKEESDVFQIYSLVGVDIKPENFTLVTNETKTIRIALMPEKSFFSRKEPLPFVYQIKNSKNEIQKETITIAIMDLERAISVIPENIDPFSNSLDIELKNRASYEFKELNLKFSSVFFKDYQTSILLEPFSSKKISIPIDKEKVKTLETGKYLLNVFITAEEKSAKKEETINFVERPNIETTTTTKGFFIKKEQITKKNIGNTKERVKITTEKNFLSYLFTTYSSSKGVSSFDIKTENFKKVYIWEKELSPNDELEVIVTTNWFFPILILVFIVALIVFIKKSIEKDFVFRKIVSFVRTKGGEFALRITLRIKAKRYVEKISVVDKLPHLVNLYEKFGAIPPNRIDLTNRRLEWNIESMSPGEERVFSYIIYSSKIGVIGKFELPSAKAIYERGEKIKEIVSNKSFFINEPRQKKLSL